MATAPQSVEDFGPYRLTHLLGKGGMASVYRAVRQGPMGFAKEVAIKRIHESLTDNESILKGLINEARIGGQLKHPNIVEIYEFNKVDDLYYLSMEFVDGWTLDRILKLARQLRLPIPPSVILDVARQVCEGLDYAHKLQSLDGQAVRLVHRDLKPANVILGRHGVTKLMDFGIAKAATNLFQTTMADVTKGTPHYMSPEQVAGAKDLTAASDLFALGALLYELTTGKVLFVGDSLPTVLFNVVKAEVGPQIRDAEALVPGIGPILEGLLRKDPRERTQDAGTVGQALEELRASRCAGGPTPRQYLYALRERLIAGETAQSSSQDKDQTVADETIEAKSAAADPEFATMLAPALEPSPAGDGLAEARRLADAEIGAVNKVFAGTGALQVDTFGATSEAIGSLVEEAQQQRAPRPADNGFAAHGGLDTHPNQRATRAVAGATRKMAKRPGAAWSGRMLGVAAVLGVLLLVALAFVLAQVRAPPPSDDAAALQSAAPTVQDLGLDGLTAADAATTSSTPPELSGPAPREPRPRPDPSPSAPTPTPRGTPSPADAPTPGPVDVAATPPPPAPTPADPPAPTPSVSAVQPAGTGWVSIKTSTPYARVFIDGIDVGKTTPLMRFELPAGPHKLVLVAVEMDKRSAPRSFKLAPGETLKIGHYDFLSESWSE